MPVIVFKKKKKKKLSNWFRILSTCVIWYFFVWDHEVLNPGSHIFHIIHVQSGKGIKKSVLPLRNGRNNATWSVLLYMANPFCVEISPGVCQGRKRVQAHEVCPSQSSSSPHTVWGNERGGGAGSPLLAASSLRRSFFSLLLTTRGFCFGGRSPGSIGLWNVQYKEIWHRSYR